MLWCCDPIIRSLNRRELATHDASYKSSVGAKPRLAATWLARLVEVGTEYL